MIRVGKFEVDVSNPYPVWITLSLFRGEQRITFKHDELGDLRHAINQAMREAESKLSKWKS